MYAERWRRTERMTNERTNLFLNKLVTPTNSVCVCVRVVRTAACRRRSAVAFGTPTPKQSHSNFHWRLVPSFVRSCLCCDRIEIASKRLFSSFYFALENHGLIFDWKIKRDGNSNERVRRCGEIVRISCVCVMLTKGTPHSWTVNVIRNFYDKHVHLIWHFSWIIR